MSVQISFSLPSVTVVRHIGAIVIKHGQLEHVQRIALKRILKITIHDKRYVHEVQGLMPKELREKVATQLKTSPVDQETKVELSRLLKEARRVSTERNKLVHGAWSREVRNNPRARREPLMLRDTGKTPESIPSVSELKKLASDIDAVRDQLNKLTRPFL
jgi:hypothetical protein